MPKAAIRFAESAIADLEAIRTWYAEQRVPDIGERFVEEIVTRIEALRDYPEMGRIVPEFDQPLLRELIHPPFRIVYHRDPKQYEWCAPGAGMSRHFGLEQSPEGMAGIL